MLQAVESLSVEPLQKVAKHFHYSGVIATVSASMLCGNYGARVGMTLIISGASFLQAGRGSNMTLFMFI